jgi:hypothetical protein
MAWLAIWLKIAGSSGDNFFSGAGLIEQSSLLCCQNPEAETKKVVPNTEYPEVGHEIVLCRLIHSYKLMTKGR